MQSSVESLEGNKVKVHVAVPADEFERAIDAAFRKLAGEVRIPGFRPGKAPRQLLEARLGVDLAREQALRDSLPEYYVEAVRANDVDVIAPPEIEILAGQADGDVEFDAIVEVRPEVELPGYDGLRVEVPFEPVDDDDVSAQVDALRGRFAELADSEHPITDDVYATIDITGSIDGEEVGALSATEFLYRVGSDAIVSELDTQLHGARPGAMLAFDAALPERFGDLAGRTASFKVVVKNVQQRILPELTDEWVSEASEFDTVDELRADLRTRLETIAKVRARMALRDKVLEAAADLVPIAAPETLVDQEVERRVHDLAHSLARQGASLEQYLSATGRDAETFLGEIREGAHKAVLADLAIRSVIAREEITASDTELDAEIERMAEQAGEKPQRLRRDLEKRGLVEAVRSEIARSKALQLLIDGAEVVDEHGERIDLTLPEAPAPEGPEGIRDEADEPHERHDDEEGQPE
jgi:trigger factor